MRFARGVFTISIDFELMWGTLDLRGYRHMERLCRVEREQVVGRLLDLLTEFDISATWCTVGHLFLDRCGGEHPELVRSTRHDHRRLRRDPGTCEDLDPLFYGRDLVERIRRCPVEQEIGSHSFSHVLFGDPRCSRETAASELRAVVAAAARSGLRLRSFVFPRNQVGHVDLLAQYGFTCFRGKDRTWYARNNERGWLHRAAHLVDILTAATPPVAMPIEHRCGVWEIPGSMLYAPSFGVRKFIPVSLRVTRARKGLFRAARSGRIFHLWFHPTDLAERADAMLDGLRQILETAAWMRARGDIEILSMGALAERLVGTPEMALPGQS